MEVLQKEPGSHWIDCILHEVADKEGVDVLDLPPLYDAIDPDALESILTSLGEEPVTIEFTYLGYRIVVDNGGQVVLIDEAD